MCQGTPFQNLTHSKRSSPLISLVSVSQSYVVTTELCAMEGELPVSSLETPRTRGIPGLPDTWKSTVKPGLSPGLPKLTPLAVSRNVGQARLGELPHSSCFPRVHDCAAGKFSGINFPGPRWSWWQRLGHQTSRAPDTMTGPRYGHRTHVHPQESSSWTEKEASGILSLG